MEQGQAFGLTIRYSGAFRRIRAVAAKDTKDAELAWQNLGRAVDSLAEKQLEVSDFFDQVAAAFRQHGFLQIRE